MKKNQIIVLMVLTVLIIFVGIGFSIFKIVENNGAGVDKENLTINQDNNINKNNVPSNDITYITSIKNETEITIEAIQNGTTITKDLIMDAAIYRADIIVIPNIGRVVFITLSGGEYYGIEIYQLVADEIKAIGSIDYINLMLEKVSYNINVRDESYATINTTVQGKTISKEFAMDATIAWSDVVIIQDDRQLALVATSSGEGYAVKVYQLKQDDYTGDIIGIEEVGFIDYNIPMLDEKV
jgi:hypothetical protein